MVNHDREHETRTSPEGEAIVTTTPRTGEFSSEGMRAGSFFNRNVSWGAIFAGSVVALVVMVLLNLLGLGIGAAAMSPTSGEDAQAFGIGAGIWTIVVLMISLFVGGWVAGRLSGITMRYESVLHGLAVWGVVTLASMFLLATAAGQLIGGAVGLVTQTATAASDVPAVQQLINEQIQQQQQQQPAAAEGQAAQQQQQQQAAQTAEEVSSGVSYAAFFGFIALLLGGLLAALGGIAGARSLATTDRFEEERRNRGYVPGRVSHA